jgi:hypothetical protein
MPKNVQEATKEIYMGLIDQMMANLYKPPKQEKQTAVLPKHLTPAK